MQKLSAEDTLAAYKRINSGYKRKAVFQLTLARGFGCNINRMVLAVLYCLVHEFQFQLGLDNWLPDRKAGAGIFVPFCAECDFQCPPAALPGRVNTLKYALLWEKLHPCVPNLNAVILAWARKIPGRHRYSPGWWISFLRCRRLNRMCEKVFSRHFVFPQLGIDGDVFQAKSVILKMVFQPSAEVVDGHRAAMEDLKPYISVHVRRGDKMDVEAKEIEVLKYLKKIQSLAPGIRNIFVATDDYRVVSDFRKLRPDLNIVTLCSKEKEGYSQQEFMENPDQEEELARFLVDLYYLENADYFVGAYSSNISRIVALLKGKETCYSLDKAWYPG